MTKKNFSVVFLYLLLLISIPLGSLFYKNTYITSTSNKNNSPHNVVSVKPQEKVLGTYINLDNLTWLDNSSQGYRFQYPQDWQVNLIDNRIELSTSSAKGRVIVNYKQEYPEITYDINDSSDEDITLFKNVSKIIQKSIEKIDKEEIKRETVRNRFIRG